MDYRLAWHLHEVLRSIGMFAGLPHDVATKLHVDFAAQLERAGLWDWSIFMLLRLPDSGSRTSAIRELVCRSHPLHVDSTVGCDQPSFGIIPRLGLSPSLFHHASAIWSQYKFDFKEEVKHLTWREARWARLVANMCAPRLYLEDPRRLDALRQFFVDAGWDTIHTPSKDHLGASLFDKFSHFMQTKARLCSNLHTGEAIADAESILEEIDEFADKIRYVRDSESDSDNPGIFDDGAQKRKVTCLEDMANVIAGVKLRLLPPEIEAPLLERLANLPVGADVKHNLWQRLLSEWSGKKKLPRA